MELCRRYKRSFSLSLNQVLGLVGGRQTLIVSLGQLRRLPAVNMVNITRIHVHDLSLVHMQKHKHLCCATIYMIYTVL